MHNSSLKVNKTIKKNAERSQDLLKTADPSSYLLPRSQSLPLPLLSRSAINFETEHLTSITNKSITKYAPNRALNDPAYIKYYPTSIIEQIINLSVDTSNNSPSLEEGLSQLNINENSDIE